MAEPNTDKPLVVDNEVVARVFPLSDNEPLFLDQEEYEQQRRLQRMAKVLAFQAILQQ